MHPSAKVDTAANGLEAHMLSVWLPQVQLAQRYRVCKVRHIISIFTRETHSLCDPGGDTRQCSVCERPATPH
jgi:hypothetical protein